MNGSSWPTRDDGRASIHIAAMQHDWIASELQRAETDPRDSGVIRLCLTALPKAVGEAQRDVLEGLDQHVVVEGAMELR